MLGFATASGNELQRRSDGVKVQCLSPIQNPFGVKVPLQK